MAGIDANAKLVLHCNGTDTSTSFPDASPSAHSPSAVGDAQVDTAQKVFGTGSALLDGAGDYISVPDSADWDFGTNDMALDFRYRFNSLSGSQCWIGRPTSGSSYFYFAWEGGGIRCRDFPGGFDVNFGAVWTPVVDTWYHIAITRDGNNWRFFVDGVQKGSTIVNSGSFLSRPIALTVGSNPAIGYHCNGWMDEVRVSNGDSRWTANFTPPTQEYSSGDVTVVPNILTITSEIIDPTLKIDTVVIPSILTLTSQLNEPLVGQVVTVTPNVLTITSSIESPIEKIDATVTPSILTIQSQIKEPIFPVTGSLIGKIISVNPLIAVTDTNPVQIIKIDITDPENLVYTSVTIPNISNAKDVAVDYTGDYVYVAGSNGKIVKVEIVDLTNQITLDLSDTDDLITIESNVNFGITYAGTDNSTGELYTLDERSTFKLNSDFTCLSPQELKIGSNFNIVSTFKMDSAFTALSYQTFKMNSAFNCFGYQPALPIISVDDVEPIKETDYEIYIDGNLLENTDLILNSIQITLSVGEESRASFRLTRKHDDLNTTLEGISSIITNQNTVEIKCNGRTIFPYNGQGTGRISELDCQYQDNVEFVAVNALSEEATNKFNNITMSLPGLNSRLSLYDILIENPIIFNPYIDSENEDNPKKFKGIRVNLGTKSEQSVSKWDIFDSTGSIAESIQDGTFNPIQNWTYFWSPTVTKFGNVNLGETSSVRFFYIGTSLAPVSEDLWNLEIARHFRQRIFDDIETELGYYEVGDAPFKDVSVRNDQKITKPKLTDEPDGLYSIKDAGYNFIDYAKRVADLEYEKLKNINGDILPDTSCNFNLTIDAYLYYEISLLTQINVDNTTESNVYYNNNGFPVSVKSITITSQDRKVSIEADNLKSVKELETLNSEYPDENADEYNEKEQRTLIYLKSDMRTRLKVQ